MGHFEQGEGEKKKSENGIICVRRVHSIISLFIQPTFPPSLLKKVASGGEKVMSEYLQKCLAKPSQTTGAMEILRSLSIVCMYVCKYVRIGMYVSM